MGRTKTQVDKQEFLDTILDLESSQTFSNRNELAIAVSLTNWGINNGVTSSVCVSRIKEFNLDTLIKTPKGKRGRQVGEKLSDEHKQKLQEGRGKKKVDEKWIKEMRRVTPTAYFPIIDKIESGSLKAQLKLMCLFCTNFNKSEVKNCTINSCPLYAGRPYQVNSKND